MNTRFILLLAALAVAVGGAYLLLHTHDDHADGDGHSHGTASHGKPADGHGDDDHGESQATTITPEAAKAAGIEVETAGPANLGERVPLRGRIMLNPETSAEVRARFPGVVKSVRKAIGDPVAKGETLATVESNDSLQTYAVTSPLAGTVLARNANVGQGSENASGQPMFTVANLSTVTAELHVFPQDMARVHVGQEVRVESVDGTVDGIGKIKALLPTTDADTQTVQAWVTLDNADNRWRSGMAVQGGALVGKSEVPLAVRNTALQTMDDKTVVFVKEGDTYEAHLVKLGRTDGVYTEVLGGLTAGNAYVGKNSFIVKADIGKAGAAHEH